MRGRVEMPTLVGQWVYLQRKGNCYKAVCPFHNDSEPSLAVYQDHAYCFGCKRYWTPISWLRDFLNIGTVDEAIQWLRLNYGGFSEVDSLPISNGNGKLPIPFDPEIISYWHLLAVRNGAVGYYLERGLTEKTVEQYQLGWTGQAYVIPIWEDSPGESDVVVVKFRSSDPDSDLRYWHLEGRGHPRLFNKHILVSAKEAVIVIGEFDALIGMQWGFHTVSGTAGQSTWLWEWSSYFDNVNHIYVVPDHNESAAGLVICSHFNGRVSLCQFPEDTKDLTEFALAGYTADDFRGLVLSHNLLDTTEASVEAFYENS